MLLSLMGFKSKNLSFRSIKLDFNLNFGNH